MTRKIAKPMTAQDRAVLRAAILLALNAGPMLLAELEVSLKFSEKRVYRELLTLQETGDVVRHGGGRSTRYGLKTVRWVDGAINPRPKKAATQVSGPSWWESAARDGFTSAAIEILR